MTDPSDPDTEIECLERLLRDMVPLLAKAEKYWTNDAKVLLDRVVRALRENWPVHPGGTT